MILEQAKNTTEDTEHPTEYLFDIERLTLFCRSCKPRNELKRTSGRIDRELKPPRRESTYTCGVCDQQALLSSPVLSDPSSVTELPPPTPGTQLVPDDSVPLTYAQLQCLTCEAYMIREHKDVCTKPKRTEYIFRCPGCSSEVVISDPHRKA